MRWFLSALAATTAVFAAPTDLASALSKRCVNSASDRSCWGDYDLSTNYYETVPDTGVTREYWFNIQNGTGAPDGIERVVLTVNGSFPGPTIIANWGDQIVVHVTNNMENNGTGIHFHGIRQLNNNIMDGVPSMTQCPIAPGDSFTYTWQASQYGSSWYHSHFYVQAWDGVLGGIIVNGPASSNYDEDLGNLFLTDWSHTTSDQVLLTAVNGAVSMETSLINGTNVYNSTADVDNSTTGTRFETQFAPGKKYRLRLVNGAASTHYRFMIDNHTMEVISADFVPIVPYNTTTLSIGTGERYDVIVTAFDEASAGNFWMRSIPQLACSKTPNVDNVLGVIRYTETDGVTLIDSVSLPNTTAYDYTDSCVDEENLVPYLALAASATYEYKDNETTSVVNGNNSVLWYMGGTSFVSNWSYPSVKQIYDSDGNNTWTTDQHAVTLPKADEWVYLFIQTTSAQAHPIHLHGHDFWVLAAGDGTYNSTVELTLVDSPRRDVAMVPGDGYLVIAFYTDNPGAWLLHCHIAWHTSEGFAMQFIERESEIPALMNATASAMDTTCANWDTYQTADNVIQTDSGV